MSIIHSSLGHAVPLYRPLVAKARQQCSPAACAAWRNAQQEGLPFGALEVGCIRGGDFLGRR